MGGFLFSSSSSGWEFERVEGEPFVRGICMFGCWRCGPTLLTNRKRANTLRLTYRNAEAVSR